MSSSDDSAGSELRVICGPTGAGKSAIAMWLATQHRCAIISADSRHLYRHFDIGTAKPSRAERDRVPHFGIDLVDPSVRYTAAAWRTVALSAIDEARADGRTPLIVGGTGLYLRALFEGLFAEPDLDATRRAALDVVLLAMETAELRRWVMQMDPSRARLGRTQLVRALEVALLTGRRISDLQVGTTQPARWRPRYLVVDPGESLAARNVARTDGMIADGWVAEVRGLVDTVPADAPAWKSTGYREMGRYAQGEIGLEEARERVIVGTRQYAKRQRTWFRHQLPAARARYVNPVAPGWEVVVNEWWLGAED